MTNKGNILKPSGSVILVDSLTNRPIGVQIPLSVDGDSVYLKDIWESESDIGGFSGNVTDLFDNLHTVITDSSATNPKQIVVHFNRTVVSNAIGLGSQTGNFSNTKIEIGTSGHAYTTVIDESADNTKRQTRTFQLPITAGFNLIRFSFYTADTVTLSNCVILKTVNTVARLQAKKPDDTVTDINATAGGNLKISLEELESGISSNSNSQLNVTLFDSSGNEFGQDTTTSAFKTIDYGHNEIHAGYHFFNKDWIDLSNGATYDILIVTPNTTKWGHFLFIVNTEAEANIIFYKDTITSDDGTSLDVFNRNENSVNTNDLLLYHTPTVTNVGTQFARYKTGAGKAIGGELRATQEAILKQNTKYLMRITNDTTSNNWIDWIADWYEHTNIA